MATTTYGTEYVQSSDLVSNWPGSSLSVANRIDDVSLVGNGVNNQTGTTYTLALTDGGKLVTFSNAAAIALTVPTNASVAFPTGVRIKLTNKGAGTVTVAGAGGVTLNGNQLTIAQNRSAMLYKLDTNTWVMTADPSVPADPGLVLVTSASYSAQSSVSVNSCFTSTYFSYRIIIWGVGSTDGSGATALRARLRASGSDNSTNYRESHIYNTNSAGPTRAFATGATSMLWGWMFDGNGGSIVVDISGPQTTDKTTGLTAANTFGSVGALFGVGGVSHDSASSFDGFTFFPASGTITGTVWVYGYRNAV